MSLFRRFFQPSSVTLEPGQPAPPPAPPTTDAAGETATVRRIVERLDALPPEQARFIACVAYVVTRAANADRIVTPEESAYLETALRDAAGIDEAQAVLVVEMAKLQALTVGGTEDYLVTREFRKVSTPEQRLRVLHACLAVSAVDGSISAEESAVVNEIANELGIEDAQLSAARGEFADKFAAVQAARRATGG